eukprot:759911-Hanusia_phi.AAC.1
MDRISRAGPVCSLCQAGTFAFPAEEPGSMVDRIEVFQSPGGRRARKFSMPTHRQHVQESGESHNVFSDS